MNSVFKEIIDKLPPWAFHAFGMIILLALCVFLYFMMFGAKKLSTIFQSILKRDDRIEDLHDKLNAEKEKSSRFESESLQMTTACNNLRPILEALNNIRVEADHTVRWQEIHQLMQKCLDTLASDIKTKAGGLHRCGLWWKQPPDELILMVASSGFPKNYAGKRSLNINRSIAGRCNRRMQVINVDDVSQDKDWEPNPEAKNHYKSLICVPVTDWVVLTVDGHQPMNNHVQLLSELYATILEGIIYEQNVSLPYLVGHSGESEASAGSEDVG